MPCDYDSVLLSVDSHEHFIGIEMLWHSLKTCKMIHVTEASFQIDRKQVLCVCVCLCVYAVCACVSCVYMCLRVVCVCCVCKSMWCVCMYVHVVCACVVCVCARYLNCKISVFKQAYLIVICTNN